MKKWQWIIVALGGAVLLWFVLRGGGTAHQIGSDQAHQLVAKGARLVDVRTESEFRAGHLEGAINIPLQSLLQRSKELEPKDKPIVVYCRSGRRSDMARRQLQEAGFSGVYDLGPQTAW